MSVNNYNSDDGTAKVSIDTGNDYEVTIYDLTPNPDDSFVTPILPDDGEELDGFITPGFKNGKIMIWIARKIKEALS
jgi:hypothetical protein